MVGFLLCEPEAHPRCWSFATLLSWAFDPVRPRPNEGNVNTSFSAATIYVVLHDGQTFFFLFSLISSDREGSSAVLQYSLLFNIAVH